MDDHTKQKQNGKYITVHEALKNLLNSLRPHLLNLWKNKLKFIIFNFFIGVIVVGYLVFIADPYYESSVSILPEYGNKTSLMSSISGVASIAGLNLGEGSSTSIYENLLKSETVLKKVIYDSYKTKKYKDSVNLIKYLEIEADPKLPEDLKKREKFLKLYSKFVKGDIFSTNLDLNTQILSYKVTMPESRLASEVANNIAESLNNYLMTQRKNKSTQQLSYLEKRLNQVKDSLRIAEEKLKQFREQNRVIANSPDLLLRQGRLVRQVEIKQNVYKELKKQYELVKLQEIKDTPILNIKEKADNPVKKAGPNRLMILILIMFFSVIFSAFFLLIKDSLKDYYAIIKHGKEQ